nr:primosomal replication protein N [Tepidimonas alkaliphilus]
MQAKMVERAALRYTPAGLAVQELVLEHQSWQEEAEGQRLVNLRIQAVAMGVLAERLAHGNLGAALQCQGFLLSPRRGRSVVFHIQSFELLQES